MSFVPVHWRLVWAVLRALELAGVQTRFRSDSLVGMAYQDPQPSFARLQLLGFSCRPFAVTAAMVS